MTHGAQAGPTQSADPSAPAGPSDDARDGSRGTDAGALGQAIAARLFSAGLDLHFALMLSGDGPAAQRLRHAVGELDDAIRDLRSLLLALPGPAAGAFRTASSPGPGSESGLAAPFRSDPAVGVSARRARPDPGRPGPPRDGSAAVRPPAGDGGDGGGNGSPGPGQRTGGQRGKER
jgi:hypothetical protein